jgi:hypothetical protein
VKQIVTPDGSGVRVRKERKSESHLLMITAIDLNRIDADGCEMDATRREIRKTLLETPQLGVAERSPVAAVKDQDRAVR